MRSHSALQHPVNSSRMIIQRVPDRPNQYPKGIDALLVDLFFEAAAQMRWRVWETVGVAIMNPQALAKVKFK